MAPSGPVFGPASLLALLAALAVASGPAWAQSDSGIQITPDLAQVLISRDVGGERWAITRNVQDGTVTGNVFSGAGSDPRFVWCEERSRAESDVTLGCYGADRCPLTPCGADEWPFLAEVTLPASFFQPRPEGPARAGSSSPARAAGSAGASDSGVQVSRDLKRTLISKDIAGERWAITYDLETGTLTGNVFFPDGGEPRFVWCEKTTGATPTELSATCFGADRCIDISCPADGDWTFLADVLLPTAFVEPDAQIDAEDLVGAIESAFGPEGGFEAVAYALDRGYRLRQIARAGLSGRLLSSGEISTREGGIETPHDPPVGLLAAAIAGATVSQEGPPQLSLEDFRNAADLAQLMQLMNAGYTWEAMGEIVQLTLARPCTGKDGRFRWCRRDTMEPIPPTGTPAHLIPVCGDGSIDRGEDCDGERLRGRSCACADQRFSDGDLGCHPPGHPNQCEYDTSSCVELPPCNNDGVRDPDELCDGEQFAEPLTCDSGTPTCFFCLPRCIPAESPQRPPATPQGLLGVCLAPEPEDPFPWGFSGVLDAVSSVTTFYKDSEPLAEPNETRTITPTRALELTFLDGGEITGSAAAGATTITPACPQGFIFEAQTTVTPLTGRFAFGAFQVRFVSGTYTEERVIGTGVSGGNFGCRDDQSLRYDASSKWSFDLTRNPD